MKSYTVIFLTGILAGILTRLTDFGPRNSIWGISAIATLFGFWIFSETVIVLCSSSNKNAAINVFLYMFGMTLSFYLLKYILGWFLPAFSGNFQSNLFILYSVLSVMCAIGAYILYYWNKAGKWAPVLYALPVSGLLAEAIGVGIYFFINRSWLFQLVFDFLTAGLLGIFFYKKVKNKVVYFITVILGAAMVFLLVYRPGLSKS